MIDPKQLLSPGNLLQFEDGEIKTVHGIHPSKKYIHDGKQWLDLFRFSPIPLTDEVFDLKLGFKSKRFRTCFYRDDMYGMEFFLTEFGWALFRQGSNKQLSRVFNYVHEIQNVVADLTGTELEIK